MVEPNILPCHYFDMSACHMCQCVCVCASVCLRIKSFCCFCYFIRIRGLLEMCVVVSVCLSAALHIFRGSCQAVVVYDQPERVKGQKQN